MTEVRDLSSQKAITSGFNPSHQHGLFATRAYKLGETILSESPLIILSHTATLRSQFVKSCLVVDEKEPTNDDDANAKGGGTISDHSLALPALFTDDLTKNDAKKLKGLILAAACYAVEMPTMDDEAKEKLFQLFHPSLKNQDNGDKNCEDDDEKQFDDALNIVNVALSCCQQIAAPESSLQQLVKDANGANELVTLLLIYSCNAFEGGRVYDGLSRVNHSCNPNAVVRSNSSGDDNDVSVLKAACDIAKGEEINISYLGRYLYAGYPTRQRVLRDSKYFVCRCYRCRSTSHDDLASRIPCPKCHPRTGRHLEEDVMFDDCDEGDLTVSYATPKNGMTAEQRSIKCEGCRGITSFDTSEESLRKKKEAMCIKFTCMAEDKVYDRLESNDNLNDCSSNDKSLDVDVEREADEQFYQMATSICGAKHWSTHFMNLSLIEEALANFHASLMSSGQSETEDVSNMDELFTDIAEAADGIERAWKYANDLSLKIDPSHWLFDYSVGLARILVGLGDEKSQKYAAEWITKVEDYAKVFESDGMQKVVMSLKNAWKRQSSGGKEEETKTKRQKIA